MPESTTRTIKKRNLRRKGRSTKNSQMMRKIAKAEAYKMVNKLSESKYWDTGVLRQPVDSTGFVVPLSQIPLGTDVDQRVGDRIRMRALSIKGFMASQTTYQAPGYPSTEAFIARVIVFQWHPQALGNPTMADILQLGGVAAQNEPMAPRNRDQGPLYTILVDKYIELSRAQAVGNVNNVQLIDISLSFDKVPKKFNFTPTVTLEDFSPWNPIDGLFMGFITGAPPSVLASDLPFVSYESRLNFTDV